MTEYGILLRKLLDFTGSKLYAVADEVGYDVSYISKWCNKDLLPAPKTAHIVDEALGKYFAMGIQREGREEAFESAFHDAPRNLPLEKQIGALLTAAYEASAVHHRASSAAGGAVELLTQRHEMLGRVRDLRMARQGTEGEIVCTIDLLTLLESRDLAGLDHLLREGGVHLHAALDVERFRREPEKSVRALCRFLSCYRESYITLYDGAGLERENLVAIRDGSALMTVINRRGELDALLVAEGDPGARLYETALGRLKERPVVLCPARSEDMNRNGYRTDFYSRDRFKFYSHYGFEFLLPPSVCDHLAQASSREQGAGEDRGWEVRRLFITWEEVFQKSQIDFYMLKSSALRYLESGELLFEDIAYRMSPAERLEHLKNVKEQVLSNPGIRFVLIDDDGLLPEDVPAFSVYLNPKKLFIKSPWAYQSGKGPQFYTVQSDTLQEAVREYLTALETLPRSGVYDHRDVEDIEKRYGGMFYRMLTMQEEQDG